MAELAIEPVELPPGRVEELPLPGEQTPAKPAQDGNGTPAQATPVSGSDLLKELPKSSPETVNEQKEETSPFEGKRGKHPKACTCSACKKTRKIKELLDRENGVRPSIENIPQADFSDINLPPGVSTQTQPGGSSPETRPDFLAMAKVTFGMSEGLLCTVFGPEWKRESEDEMMSIAIPLSVCLEQWGLKDLPPGYVLCFVCLAYAGKRVNKPATAGKLKMGWLWLKSKFQRRKKSNSVETPQPKESNV